jgi:hypothetical protein
MEVRATSPQDPAALVDYTMPVENAITPRYSLRPTPEALWSSHFWEDGSRARLCNTNHGDLGPPLVLGALLALDRAVFDAGGRLYVIQLRRSHADQQEAYDSGRSPVKPGLSTHQSGHGADLQWPGITDARFVEIARGLGWSSVTDDPPHWEYRHLWARLFGARGPGEMAMAMCLDQGQGGYGNDEARALQAQIWRVYEPGCGAIDGIIGEQTRAALRALGLREDAGYRDLYRLLSV